MIDTARSFGGAVIVTATGVGIAYPVTFAVAALIGIDIHSPVVDQGLVGILLAVFGLAVCLVAGRYVGFPLANRFIRAAGGVPAADKGDK